MHIDLFHPNIARFIGVLMGLLFVSLAGIVALLMFFYKG